MSIYPVIPNLAKASPADSIGFLFKNGAVGAHSAPICVKPVNL
jgi:hypothetical protein